MRKLLFFSIAMSLLLGMNAQREIQKSESVPMQKPSIEKEMNVLFAPTNDVNVFNNYNESKPTRKDGDKPVRKANYTTFGQITNADFAAYNRNNTTADWKFTHLFPDSLACRYQHYQNGDSTFKYHMWSSTGFTFDPYSTSFDMYETEGLFEKAGRRFAYRLDTLHVLADYRMPNGYNQASPDTLRFYITDFGPYPVLQASSMQYTDYWTLSFQSITAHALCPKFDYLNPIPNKGVGTVMKSVTRIVNHLLDDKDSALAQPGYVARRLISVPINGGYEVPAEHCLSVIVEYVPGFTYNVDDTLCIHTWNTALPVGSQFISEDWRMNTIALIGWDYTDADVNYLFDSKGYNTGLMQTQAVRYMNPETGTDSSSVTRTIYAPNYYLNTVFLMSLSVDNEFVSIPTYDNDLVSNIYPNPATSQLTIDLNEAGTATVTIYNILGQAVIEETVQNVSNKINIAELSSGLYFVKVNQNGRNHTVKISKE